MPADPAVQEQQEFVQLRQRTSLTDGNLSSHAKRLHGAGLVAIDKTFRDGKPVFMLHRHQIENRDAMDIAKSLTQAFDEFCVKQPS